MLGQVLRRPRRRAAREIGGRADHRHAQVRPDAHGDHVLGDLLAEPHAGVEALGDDVGQAVVDDELDRDVGIARQQLLQRRPQDRVARHVRAAVIRIVPAGLSRSSLSAASPPRSPRTAGATRRSSRSPASVGETLRVVRVRRRTPSRASRPRMVWLSADCETPSLRRRAGEAALLAPRPERR